MNTPVRKTMCATCPFRDSKRALREARNLLVFRALGLGGAGPPETSAPECHSTGTSDIDIGKKGPKPPAQLCRGARNLQLSFFFTIGFIDAPTDEAWQRKRDELGC
jgi:hypothetical protein